MNDIRMIVCFLVLTTIYEIERRRGLATTLRDCTLSLANARSR